MPDSSVALDESLSYKAFPCNAHFDRGILTLFIYLIGAGLPVHGYEKGVLGASAAFGDSQKECDAFSGYSESKCQRSKGAGLGVLPYEHGALSDFVTTSSEVDMPRLIYTIPYHGKTKASTEGQLMMAMRAGFQGLQIAGQPWSYYHPGVDSGLQALFTSGMERSSLFIQISINPKLNIEMNPEIPPAKHVERLIDNALSNLGLDYIDSVLLHAPFPEHAQTIALWRAMEDAVRAGLVRQLGIWNLMSLKELRRMYADVTVKPAVVQQLFFAQNKDDREIRAWCAKKGIYTPTSWRLTADERMIDSLILQGLAVKYDVEPAILFLRFVAGLKMVPLIALEDIEKEYPSALHIPLTAEDSKIIDDFWKQKASDEKRSQKTKMATEESEATQRFEAHVLAMKECASQDRWDESLSLIWSRHSTSKQPISPEPPKVVALIASYIRNKARLTRVEQLLASIAAQVGYKPAAILASVSSATSNLLKSARLVFAQFEQDMLAQGTIVNVSFRTTPHTQFEHYASLVEPLKKLSHSLEPSQWSKAECNCQSEVSNCQDVRDVKEGSANIWLVFTDDDDLWHPYRILTYSQAINQTLKSHGMVPISIPINSQNTGSDDDFSTTVDVDDMMKSGSGRIIQYSVLESQSKPILLQYWSHAVPFRVFLDFLLCAPPAALKHESCDYRFSTFMRDHSSSSVMLVESSLSSKLWMYFHRQHNEGRVSTGLWAAAKIKPLDSELANEIRGSLKQSYEGHWHEETVHPGGRQDGEDPVLRICAELRRTVERHLCVYGALLAKPAIISGALEYQRLQGTRDKDRWGQLVEKLVDTMGPSLLLPNHPKPGTGFLGKGGYQKLLLDKQFWGDLKIRHLAGVAETQSTWADSGGNAW